MIIQLKRIKCQLSLALIFSSAGALAEPTALPTAPVCQVAARVISVNGKHAIIEVGGESKIIAGEDKDRPCSYTKSKKIAIEVDAKDLKKLKPGTNFLADLQQTGPASDVAIKTDNIKMLKQNGQ